MIQCEALPRANPKHCSPQDYSDRRKLFNSNMKDKLIKTGGKGLSCGNFNNEAIWFWPMRSCKGQPSSGMVYTSQTRYREGCTLASGWSCGRPRSCSEFHASLPLLHYFILTVYQYFVHSHLGGTSGMPRAGGSMCHIPINNKPVYTRDTDLHLFSYVFCHQVQ